MSTGETPEHTIEAEDGRPPLALIAGPTASGKSGLAVRLAQQLGAQGRRGVVVNADSAQVYANLQVLSARPDAAEMDGIEHRLFGSWDGATACSAADWALTARREITRLHSDGAVPILCGGTGLYIRALLDGLAPVPAIDPAVREQIRALPPAELRAALEQEDPAAASRLAPADSARTARALEVVRSTGRTLTDWQSKKTGGIGAAITLHPLILLPDRATLYERCDARFAAMLEQGAVEEVERLLERSLDPALPVMRAIGVREIAGWLRGEMSREEMVAAGSQATRNYAKRQYTWFRRQPPAEWPRDESDSSDLQATFVSLLRKLPLT